MMIGGDLEDGVQGRGDESGCRKSKGDLRGMGCIGKSQTSDEMGDEDDALALSEAREPERVGAGCIPNEWGSASEHHRGD